MKQLDSFNLCVKQQTANNNNIHLLHGGRKKNSHQNFLLENRFTFACVCTAVCNYTTTTQPAHNNSSIMKNTVIFSVYCCCWLSETRCLLLLNELKEPKTKKERKTERKNLREKPARRRGWRRGSSRRSNRNLVVYNIASKRKRAEPIPKFAIFLVSFQTENSEVPTGRACVRGTRRMAIIAIYCILHHAPSLR